MDQLEKYIAQKREDFDDQIQEDFLWNKIEIQLNNEKPIPKRKLKLHWVWQAAAAVFIFATAWFSREWFDKSVKNPEQLLVNQAIDSDSYYENIENKEISIHELPKVEVYFTSQIQERQAELEKYCKQHPEILEDLKAEFKEMDKDENQIQRDLIESQADERVIEAIVQKYRVKLDILESLLDEMQRNQPQSTDKSTEKLF